MLEFSSFSEEFDRGQEAFVQLGRPEKIEGIGGILKIPSPREVVKRTNSNQPLYSYEGHDTFCKHLAARLLEEYFKKTGRYKSEHIPKPLGSFNGGYYYEYAVGGEGWPTSVYTPSYGQEVSVTAEEWGEFTNGFNLYGFSVDHDTANSSDGRIGKNVIFEEWDESYRDTFKLHERWKRIDFGQASMPFNYERFQSEIQRSRIDLTKALGEEKYIMLCLSGNFVKNHVLSRKAEEIFAESVLRFRKSMVK